MLRTIIATFIGYILAMLVLDRLERMKMVKTTYPTLLAEMAKRRIKKKDICELLGISQKTLWNKIEGHSEFTLEEAKLVRKTYFDDMTIDELFRN